LKERPRPCAAGPVSGQSACMPTGPRRPGRRIWGDGLARVRQQYKQGVSVAAAKPTFRHSVRCSSQLQPAREASAYVVFVSIPSSSAPATSCATINAAAAADGPGPAGPARPGPPLVQTEAAGARKAGRRP
jgi:hypothetical protein